MASSSTAPIHSIPSPSCGRTWVSKNCRAPASSETLPAIRSGRPSRLATSIATCDALVRGEPAEERQIARVGPGRERQPIDVHGVVDRPPGLGVGKVRALVIADAHQRERLAAAREQEVDHGLLDRVAELADAAACSSGAGLTR